MALPCCCGAEDMVDLGSATTRRPSACWRAGVLGAWTVACTRERRFGSSS